MRRSIAVIAFIAFVDVLGYALVLPRTAEVAARFGLSLLVSWVLYALPVVAGVAGAAWLLRLSERHGRKPVLVGTCLVTAEALFVLGWAGDVYMLFTARIMAGLAAGNLAVAEGTLRDVLGSGSNAARVIGTGCLAGLAAGWVFGAALPYATAAYVAGVLAVASLVGVVSLLPETRPAERRAEVPSTRARSGAAH